MRRAGALPAIALAALSIIWGYNWVVMKVALIHSGPLTLAAIRFALAPICLLPLMLRTGERLLPTRAQLTPVLILGVMLAVNFAGTFVALRMSGTGKTAVLVYTMPIWVLLFARITLKERLNRLQLIAVFFAWAGLVVLIEPWRMHGAIVANLIAVAAGMSWGASVVYVKHLQRHGAMSMVALSVWQMAVAAAVLSVGALTIERGQSLVWTPGFTVALIYTSVVATGIAWLLFYYALRRMSAGMTGLGTLATPVIGVACAWLQLGEQPTPTEAVGMTLIGIGLAMLAWSGLQSARQTSTTELESR